MSDYTPSLEEAREQYWAASGDPRRDSGAWGEFDRMIETVRAEEREKANQIRISDGMIQRAREAIYAQIGHYPTITAATEILSAALSGEQDTREPSEDPCPEWQCPDLSSEDRREGKTCPDHPCTCTREPSDDPCSCPSGDGSLRHPCQAHPGDTSDREG